MAKSNEHDVAIMFWTTREQRDRLLDRARQEDRSMSSMLRVMIDWMLPPEEPAEHTDPIPLLQTTPPRRE